MEGEDQCDVRFRHITEITILTVQLIVEFAKRLPGFDKLLREDQIALLKVCNKFKIIYVDQKYVNFTCLYLFVLLMNVIFIFRNIHRFSVPRFS